ncbi:MAG TPA: hypothetical protein VGC50_13875, partial [Gammaproteobacteria bacterium]
QRFGSGRKSTKELDGFSAATLEGLSTEELGLALGLNPNRGLALRARPSPTPPRRTAWSGEGVDGGTFAAYALGA